MSSFDVSPAALDDLREIGDWTARGDPARAVSFPSELRGRFGRLAVMPLTGRPRGEIGANIRSVPLCASIIFCRPNGAGGDIVGVVHGRRDLSHGLPRRRLANRPPAAWQPSLAPPQPVLYAAVNGRWAG